MVLVAGSTPMVLAPVGVLTVWTISYFPGAVSLATAREPSRQLAKAWLPRTLVASTPVPMGRSEMILPLSVLMTMSFWGLRQPMKRRWVLVSMAIPTGEPPGATGQRAVTFPALKSTTATWSLSSRLM